MKLPPIAEKLLPAIRILDVLNDHLRVEDCFFAGDDAWVGVALNDEETSPSEELNEMVLSLITEVHSLLPEGYTVQVQEQKFVVVRFLSTDVIPDEPAMDISPWETTPVCFRLEPAACAAADELGNPIASYAQVAHYRQPGNSDSAPTRASIDSWRAIIAKRCACAPEYVIPISVEEYLAAGNSLEE